MAACLQQKDLINVNDARQSLCHSLLSQFPKLWAEFSGQVNGLNDLSEIVDQVYTLPNLQAQLAKYRTEGSSSCKVFYTTIEGASMENLFHEKPGYDGCFACQEKGHVLKDCPYVKVFQQMQNMDNKKPFSKFQRKHPGVNVVLQEEEPEDQERSSGSDSEESKTRG
ncbi:hypothetical protein DSO57_1036175 [Entomophthora muscae]|uniref:Uncharacterized protein n=1 Tax=Entomophthora muscae TaxID=34485 RepID=A0ACC2TLF2_9FUNG|nr:hypothetical protein DSO57_1036175 [Entomophthora muscae]